MGAGVGKRVRGDLYIHRSALKALDPGQRKIIEEADARAGCPPWNVARLGKEAVGLLYYADFERDAFPRLVAATRVDHATSKIGRIAYEGSLNPFILHRKELLLLRDDPRRPAWTELTEKLDRLGLFEDRNRIGRLSAWRAILAAAGLDGQGQPL
ncbi:hypothetical protein [Sphingopyxis panaciterrulae]|uniref:Uncharacterized protein n=2 Tax=Sphingopyxis TaxID=165697 RepID=A0A7W9ES42_9SPHN|nr:hypothetical protein [Sphingopyxis panaciterrulae]MBB5708372.1 hypothetical protein [Sphingopyxis panaciterrulae]SBV32639.1 conserved protein of unknown function [uncultured Sphingopyxis sp.]